MKKLIMVVDDDKVYLETARGILRDKFDIVAANSGKLALKLLERQMPDLILLDIKMPGMDGLEVMDCIQEHPLWRMIPIIFLTADNVCSHEAECLRRGAVDFIHKPFDVEVMVSRINRIIKSEEDRKELELQWQNIHNMVSVEQILFDAHRTDSGIDNAVQLICESENAARAFIIKWKSSDLAECIKEWHSPLFQPCFKENEIMPRDIFSDWQEALRNHMPISVPDAGELKDKSPKLWEFLSKRDVVNFVAAPIYFSDGTFFGFLGVDNPEKNLHSANMLSFMSLGFSMAFENMEEHKRMEKMGLYDLTTGVLNRNSYFNFTHAYEQKEGENLGVVFVDVNGLHEYNNQFGHKKGDQMLQYVAGALMRHFTSAHIFRIGGDEFLILQENTSVDAMIKQRASANQEIEQKNFAVSFGMEWRDQNIDIEEMVKIADERMYDAKADFYRSHDRRKIR